ncbi:hypothetical protein ES703_01840 [subsurface metagenome]
MLEDPLVAGTDPAAIGNVTLVVYAVLTGLVLDTGLAVVRSPAVTRGLVEEVDKVVGKDHAARTLGDKLDLPTKGKGELEVVDVGVGVTLCIVPLDPHLLLLRIVRVVNTVGVAGIRALGRIHILPERCNHRVGSIGNREGRDGRRRSGEAGLRGRIEADPAVRGHVEYIVRLIPAAVVPEGVRQLILVGLVVVGSPRVAGSNVHESRQPSHRGIGKRRGAEVVIHPVPTACRVRWVGPAYAAALYGRCSQAISSGKRLTSINDLRSRKGQHRKAED